MEAFSQCIRNFSQKTKSNQRRKRPVWVLYLEGLLEMRKPELGFKEVEENHSRERIVQVSRKSVKAENYE
jgi:hypothetical protein